MCLTKLKKVIETLAINMAIKDIIIILKLANQFGWLLCTQFQQKNYGHPSNKETSNCVMVSFL